jgi:hypothetical protein
VVERLKILEEENKVIKEETMIIKDENKTIKEETMIIKEENKVIKEETMIIKEENKTIKEETMIIKEETMIIKEENKTIKEETMIIKEENKTIKEEAKIMKGQLSLFADRRLHFFSRSMSGSGKSNLSPATLFKANREFKLIQDFYKGRCAFCNKAGTRARVISKAHLVASNRKENYDALGTANNYKNDLNLYSGRNYLPLCGSLGVQGSCHNEFDNYLITILHNSFDGTYKLHCFNPKFVEYGRLHQKVILFHDIYPPYHRLLTWRTIKCLNEHGHLIPEAEKRDIFTCVSLSEKAMSCETEG